METLVGLLVVALVVYWLFKKRQNKQRPKPSRAVKKAVSLDLPTREYSVVGMEHHLTKRQIRTINPPYLVAVPEPTNHHDRNAVKITDPSGRKVGYMSAGLAQYYHGPIKQLGSLRMECRKSSDRLHYQIPKWQDLEKHNFWRNQ